VKWQLSEQLLDWIQPLLTVHLTPERLMPGLKQAASHVTLELTVPEQSAEGQQQVVMPLPTEVWTEVLTQHHHTSAAVAAADDRRHVQDGAGAAAAAAEMDPLAVKQQLLLPSHQWLMPDLDWLRGLDSAEPEQDPLECLTPGYTAVPDFH